MLPSVTSPHERQSTRGARDDPHRRHDREPGHRRAPRLPQDVRRDTNGEAVVVECIVKPHGAVAAAHVHPHQEERFEVLRGSSRLPGRPQEARRGARSASDGSAGTAHRFWNAGDEVASFVCEIRPALQFEELVETMFGLAADGKTNRKGMPNPLRLAVIANAHFDTVRLPFPPAWMQKAGPRPRRTRRAPTRLPRHVHPDPGLPAGDRGLREAAVKRRAQIVLLFLLLILLSLPGFTAKGLRRMTRALALRPASS